MSSQRISGLVLLVVGAVLFIIGMNASHSAADRLSNFFTGHFTDATVWYLIGGVAVGLVGLSMAAFSGSASSAK